MHECHQITLDRSGQRASPFARRAMTLGEDLRKGTSVADSGAVLDRCVDLSGNFVEIKTATPTADGAE